MSRNSKTTKARFSSLVVQATKPKGQASRRLIDLGMQVNPVQDDESDAERFVLSKRLAVDRRTGNNFLNGITDKTLFTNAIYLRDHFPLAVLIVEGDIKYAYRGFDPQAVRGALSSLILEYGLNVLCTRDLEETVQLVAMMARQEQIGIAEISLIPKRKAVSLADMQRRVVEMLPGCGRVMARDLLQYFGSIARIVQASEDELRSVKGIGAGKAKEIRQVIKADYKAIDTEHQLEDALVTEPGLLFDTPVDLLARQHTIYDDGGNRHIVDLVFYDAGVNQVILVELKRGRLEPWHYEQLRRYLDHARESVLIRDHLNAGSGLRGILASTDPGVLETRHRDIKVQQLDSRRTIEVLSQLRRRRLKG